MIDPPKVVTTDARPAAVIHLTVPRDGMMRAMRPAVEELLSTLATQGIGPAGPLFAHHLKRPGEVFDFELGFPAATPVAAAGRVTPGELPAATVARTVHHGPYEGLPDAWRAFDAWMQSQGHVQASDLWEFYAVGPESGGEPASFRTELNRPLRDSPGV